MWACQSLGQGKILEEICPSHLKDVKKICAGPERCSTVKSVCPSCLARTWVCFSASTSGGSQTPLSPVPRDLIPSLGLCEHLEPMWARDTHIQIHKKGSNNCPLRYILSSQKQSRCSCWDLHCLLACLLFQGLAEEHSFLLPSPFQSAWLMVWALSLVLITTSLLTNFH